MPYRDDFDDPQGDRNISSALGAVRNEIFLRTRGPAIAGGILLLAIVTLGAVIFFTYPGEDEVETIPVIQADARPFKIVPDDPGGMQIPHRDSTVFSSMRSSAMPDEGQPVENLFADNTPEDPMPRSQLFAGLNTEEETDTLNELDPAAGSEELLNEGANEEERLFGDLTPQPQGNFPAEKIESRPEASEVVDISSRPAAMESNTQMASSSQVRLRPQARFEQNEPKLEIIQPAAPIQTTEEKIAAPKPAEPAPKPDKKVAVLNTPKTELKTSSLSRGGTHFVQIGAVKSPDAAEKGWGSYQKEYSPVLNGMDHRVERADLGTKGIYYRIQAGPLSKEKASEVCAAIKAQKPGGCLVVGQ